MTWKPQRTRLSEQVASRIKSQILAGTYTAGHRLPAERILAEELQVTRLTLREALQETERTGFTRTRHGDGTYVCDIWEEGNLQILGEILGVGRDLSAPAVRSLLEFRMVMGQGFARSIAANASPDDIESLHAIVDDERTRLDDLEGLMELSYEFEERLARASGNLIYTLLTRSVRASYLYMGRIVFESVDTLEPIVDAHEALTVAIEARDGDAVEAQLSGFIAGGNAIVEASLGPA